MKPQRTSLVVILCLVFMSSVVSGARQVVGVKCHTAEDCIGMCPFGVVAFCSGQNCYCAFVREKEKEAVASPPKNRTIVV